MKRMSKAQRQAAKRLRERGLPPAEARRVAKLSYHQLAREVSRRLVSRLARKPPAPSADRRP